MKTNKQLTEQQITEQIEKVFEKKSIEVIIEKGLYPEFTWITIHLYSECTLNQLNKLAKITGDKHIAIIRESNNLKLLILSELFIYQEP